MNATTEKLVAVIPATMPQARKRWHAHTKRVCAADVLAAAKERTVWDKGYAPTLILGNDARYRFIFERTPYGKGTTFARQVFAAGCATLADKLERRAFR